MKPGVNFEALMRDRDGRVVPGSIRSGHNVFTTAGRELLAKLFVWSTISSTDVANSHRRPRFIGVGGGVQTETQDVIRLVTPLQVTAGVYVKALDATLTTFPVFTAVTFKTVFAANEITYSASSVVVSEAGLYFDVSPGGVVVVSSDSNVPAFYKTFEPLVKLNSFSLEITWELKF